MKRNVFARVTRIAKLAVAAAFGTTMAIGAAASALAANPIGYAGQDMEKAKQAGFQFVELGVRQFTALSDEEFTKFLAKKKEVGLPTPVANNFIPSELKVVGPEVDQAKLDEYVPKALDRAKKLGIKTIVFGSGGARKVPDNFAKEEAMKQLVAFAKKIAPEAKKRGIVLAVEPLQKKETNIINTAAEGLEWVKAVNHPNFQLMVDFYHLSLEKEDPEILVSAAKNIKHIHIANPKGRRWPQSSEEWDYSKLFANLKRSKYKGGISVEGRTDDFEGEGPKTVAFLKEAVKSGVKPPSQPVGEAFAAGSNPPPATGTPPPAAAPATPPPAPAK